MSAHDQRGSSGRNELHQRNLEYTIKELQRQIREHEDQLEELRSSASPRPEIAQSPSATLAVMKAAFDEVTNSDPFFPFPDSVLPALLALRKTHRTILESREYLDSQKSSLSEANRRLEAGRADLADQKALSTALRVRIEELKTEREVEGGVSAEDVARERMRKVREQKRHYDKETSRLLKTFKKFVDERLAPLLAAEELGGPVVGDMMDVDEEDLAGGFDARGRSKKGKGGAPDEDKRQRRLEELWGGGEAEGGGGWDEKVAAGAEMRRLTEDLLNKLLGSDGNTAASYVKVDKESASARFLVRSKVAQFHPRDATLLRLVDFGREIDD
ncbi:uncharacterized protein DNG_03707 [Cephalotrichum gorgonifer]|uniref:Uncharacterized protein n=1 Tax=Cephalotrichum gorgonifer TaxID=2041049 RepID=A0AAE8STW2_9PEZI|nr:uncharacterized protein DNG_03707 [Cephalotrichum gorgonifer]